MLKEIDILENRPSMRYCFRIGFKLSILCSCRIHTLCIVIALDSNSVHCARVGFKLPIPEDNGKSVRNVMAFNVLHTVFLHATTEQLRLLVIEQIAHIFMNDAVCLCT